MVLALPEIGGVTYELARVLDGMPYTWPGFVGGVFYLEAVMWLSLRG